MPSKTPKQARTMRAAAHDPEFADKLGIPRHVVADSVMADRRRKQRPKMKRRR